MRKFKVRLLLFALVLLGLVAVGLLVDFRLFTFVFDSDLPTWLKYLLLRG